MQCLIPSTNRNTRRGLVGDHLGQTPSFAKKLSEGSDRFKVTESSVRNSTNNSKVKYTRTGKACFPSGGEKPCSVG